MILVDLTILVLLLFLAYTLMIFGVSTLTFGQAAYQAGATLLTLGIVEPVGSDQAAITFFAAFTGLAAIALVIGMLTAIYSAYLRRETPVASLSLLAGAPPWGPEMLCRVNLSDDMDAMARHYKEWTEWAAQVRLTQTVYSALNQFRSPNGRQHWVIALLAVMDAAALELALRADAPRLEIMSLLTEGSRTLTVLQPARLVDAESRQSPRAAMRMLHGGEDGLSAVQRAITADAARSEMDVPNDKTVELDQRPSTLRRKDFDDAVEVLRRAGVPITEHPNRAWLAFQHLRERYEHPAYVLADDLQAVPAPWSGPRSPETAVIWPALAVDQMKPPDTPS